MKGPRDIHSRGHLTIHTESAEATQLSRVKENLVMIKKKNWVEKNVYINKLRHSSKK